MNIGIDLGGSHIGIGLIDNGEIKYKLEKDIYENEKGKENILTLINTLINEILQKNNIEKGNIEIIGIACPGIEENGIIKKANNLNIEYFELQTEMQAIYPEVKINVRNDAKSAAIAEKRYGVLSQYDNAVMLTIGTGIGGAVFYNNELLKGNRSEAFEIGHMVIEKNGSTCSCGNKGCFEAYASITCLKQRLVRDLNIDYELAGPAIVEILKQKDIVTEQILDEYIDSLAVGLANIINIFEPQAIALGGSIVFYKDLIMDKLLIKLRKEEYVFNEDAIPDILMAKLNNDAGMIGSTIL